jgi:ABC-type lipoprotein release transport system permease subunit
MPGFILRMILRGIARRWRHSAAIAAGIAIAAGTLITLETIMQGVSDAMVRNSAAIHNGNVTITWNDEGLDCQRLASMISDTVDRAAVLPRVKLTGTLAVSDTGEAAVVFGVVPDIEKQWTVPGSKIMSGRYLTSRNEIVLGKSSAEALKATIGDKITFQPGNGREAIQLTLVGIFRTSIDSLDRGVGFVHIEDCPDGDGEIAVFLPPSSGVYKAAADISNNAPSTVTVRTWRQTLPEVSELIDLNHVSMNVVIILALVILIFGVMNSVYIAANERLHEFGVLKAMGMTPTQIVTLVQSEAILIAVISALLGIAIGIGATALLGHTGLDLTRWTNANRHFISSGVIYPRLMLRSIMLPAIASILCAVLGAALPAFRAGRLSAVEALREI